MTFNVEENFCDTIKDDMNVKTEANVCEPFEEFWGHRLTNTICWSASSSYELMSALFEIGSLVSL